MEHNTCKINHSYNIFYFINAKIEWNSFIFIGTSTKMDFVDYSVNKFLENDAINQTLLFMS